VDEKGMVDKGDIYKICKKKDSSLTFENVNNLLQSLFPEKSGLLTKEQVNELLENISKEKNELPKEIGLKKKHSENNLKLTKTSGATESSQHSIDDDEINQYVNRVNSLISEDKLLSKRYPIKFESFFQECGDGLILRYRDLLNP
jgi:hypothetical protein